jgi:hypothetical protein
MHHPFDGQVARAAREVPYRNLTGLHLLVQTARFGWSQARLIMFIGNIHMNLTEEFRRSSR